MKKAYKINKIVLKLYIKVSKLLNIYKQLKKIVRNYVMGIIKEHFYKEFTIIIMD